MNKKIIATLCVLAVTIMVGLSNIGALSARELEPGSSSDPVVTKSYVDKLIKGLQGSGSGTTDSATNDRIKAQDEMIAILNSEMNRLKSEVERLGNGETGENTYKVVDVNPGEKLIGKQGAEVILRAGEGSAIAGTLGGLQDVTGGADITTGLVPKNHLLIIPRDDGRGVLVTKKATFMVRGGYTIK